MIDGTSDRRRIGAKESARGYTFDATAEGKEFEITVTESAGDDTDIGNSNQIRTNLGAELASMIIKTRAEFEKQNIPLAITNLKKFNEERKKK